jgi:hypothetical protein
LFGSGKFDRGGEGFFGLDVPLPCWGLIDGAGGISPFGVVALAGVG